VLEAAVVTSITKSSPLDPPYVFVLVHGTFAPTAEWAQLSTSALRTALKAEFENQGVSFEPFVWRGMFSSFLNNAHRYRLRGAKALRAKLIQLRQENPDAQIFVIAHSHGGHVALYATRDTEASDVVSGIVCMATPFFVVRSDDGVLSSVESWLGLLHGLFLFGGAMLIPVSVLFAVMWVAFQVLPRLNHYVEMAFSPLFTIVGLIFALGANYLLVLVFPYIIYAIRLITAAGQRSSEKGLRAILPPDKPVFCLLALGDEFRILFRVCERLMRAAKHRFVTILLLVFGFAAVCGCQWWIVKSLRGEWAESLRNGEWTAPVIVAGGVLLSFMGLVALVTVSLLTLRMITDRLLTRLQIVIYGRENFPEMLFSDIEATPLPYGHDRICSETLNLNKLHTAKSYTMKGKSWIRHCEIYLNDESVEDIVTWVRATAALERLKCDDCVSLQAADVPDVKKPSPPSIDWSILSERRPNTSRNNI
jgi:pimeloyl-ACP methyl ester carboxylesterase